MDRDKRDIQVGLLTILAVLVFVIGLLWLKQVSVRGSVVSYAVEFPDVEALQPGDRINVRGIRMGAVDELDLVENGVRVVFHVEPGADLRQDAEFTLQTVGIVGEKVIDVMPGTGERATPGHVFTGKKTPSITQMGGEAEKALRQMTSLAEDLRKLVEQANDQDAIKGTLEATRAAADGLSDLVDENRKALTSLVDNLARTSEVLRQVVAGPDSSLAGAAERARAALTRADSVMTNLQGLTATLKDLAAGVERGEGTAGRLVTDPELYERMDRTLGSVQELLDDIRRNPERFFKVNLIDF